MAALWRRPPQPVPDLRAHPLRTAILWGGRGIPASRSFQREEGQVRPEMHLIKQYILLQQVYNKMEVHVRCCGRH